MFDSEIEMQPTTVDGGMYFVVIASIGERQSVGVVPVQIRISSVAFKIKARIHCTLTPSFPFAHMARISLLEVNIIFIPIPLCRF